ncbi:hypothetical protein M0R45_015058 [Rubus argutus]|uniref:Uncharacterized protein n=1 Tax=Rubus argutus TaxID=59490 RepID=A0AAW1XN47_RUBAR
MPSIHKSTTTAITFDLASPSQTNTPNYQTSTITNSNSPPPKQKPTYKSKSQSSLQSHKFATRITIQQSTPRCPATHKVITKPVLKPHKPSHRHRCPAAALTTPTPPPPQARASTTGASSPSSPSPHHRATCAAPPSLPCHRAQARFIQAAACDPCPDRSQFQPYCLLLLNSLSCRTTAATTHLSAGADPGGRVGKCRLSTFLTKAYSMELEIGNHGGKSQTKRKCPP